MSAWWFALAAWATVVIGGWRWAVQYKWVCEVCRLAREADSKYWQTILRCDGLQRNADLWRQQALDDRAACDAMREELQRIKSRKRRAP